MVPTGRAAKWKMVGFLDLSRTADNLESCSYHGKCYYAYYTPPLKIKKIDKSLIAGQCLGSSAYYFTTYLAS